MPVYRELARAHQRLTAFRCELQHSSYRCRSRIRIVMLRPNAIANLAETSEFSVAEWRWAIFSIGISVILLTIGFIAAGVFLWRKQTTDRTLLYFGVFAILYAIRMLLREPALLSVFAISPAVAGHIIRAITFTLALPILLLLLEVVQVRGRLVILWTLGVQLVFAPLDRKSVV